MCSAGTHFPNFADIGDTVVLFVDFGQDCKPVALRNLDQSAAGENLFQQNLVDEDEQQYKVIILDNKS